MSESNDLYEKLLERACVLGLDLENLYDINFEPQYNSMTLQHKHCNIDIEIRDGKPMRMVDRTLD